MKDDWNKVADLFTHSPHVALYDVDCIAPESETLCKRFSVKSFPTIKTFYSGNDMPVDYDGGRKFDDLKQHAESLVPPCHKDNRQLCSKAELTELGGRPGRAHGMEAAHLQGVHELLGRDKEHERTVLLPTRQRRLQVVEGLQVLLGRPVTIGGGEPAASR